MLGSGFSNAPVSRVLLFGLVVSSILASITDTKHYFYIEVVPHLSSYGQAWRLLTWQLAYTSSTELLFSAVTLYHMRIVERLWGSRKFASYLSISYILTSLLPPVLLGLVIRPLSLGMINYLPAGPTAITFSLLAQYYASIPHVYKYRVATGIGGGGSTVTAQQDPAGVVFSDKSMTYLLAGQLALSQLPGSLLAAAVGWVVGLAWRYEILLPSSVTRWRVPAWLVGEKDMPVATSARTGVEDLRRRLDESGVSGLSSGVDGADGSRRRA